MDAVAERLAAEPGLATTHAEALDRFLALGGGDFAARAGVTLADVGLARAAGEQVRLLSGGEAARVSLAAILLARFDVFLLDEPTTTSTSPGSNGWNGSSPGLPPVSCSSRTIAPFSIAG